MEPTSSKKLIISSEKIVIGQRPEQEPVWPMVIGQLNKAAAVYITLGSAYALRQA